MEHYTVFIVALKEIMAIWTPLKITLAGVLLLLVWRLPDILRALAELIGHPGSPDE